MKNSEYDRLRSARLPLLLFCLFLSAEMLAQDPTKVEPTHYKLAFENEYVQVVNVHYGPHEKSNLHSHPGGVVVILTAGHLLFTDENGKTQEVFAKPGESRWFPPFKHRVENLGNTSYDAIYIGIKDKRLANEVGLKNGSPEMDERARKLVADALVAAMDEKPVEPETTQCRGPN
jgi:quercetin dioxygenase-like cupin family protein